MDHPKISSSRYKYSNYPLNNPTCMQNSDLIIDFKMFEVVKHFINTILIA